MWCLSDDMEKIGIVLSHPKNWGEGGRELQYVMLLSDFVFLHRHC